MIEELLKSAVGRAVYLLGISMLPIVELRGGIPIGLYYDMPWQEVYLLCVIGNMIPVPFIILFIRRIFAFLKRFQKLAPWILRLEQKTMHKAEKVVKYEALGLMLFVAIPLPGTGAWTGALIAALLNLRMKIALPAIFLGVLIAGVLVMLASMGVFGVVEVLV